MGEKFIGRRGPAPIPTVQQARKIIDNPLLRETPSDQEDSDQDEAEIDNAEDDKIVAPPPRRRYRPRRLADHTGGSCDRYGAGAGIGLFCCGNCRWYLIAPGSYLKNARLNVPCKEWGADRKDLPCPVRNTFAGYFRPIRTGREQSVVIDHLRHDELFMLAFRSTTSAYEKVSADLIRYQVGQHIEFSFEGKVLSGIIQRVRLKSLVVNAGDGLAYKVRLGDIVDFHEKIDQLIAK